MNARIIRFIVQFRGEPDVGYNASLGKAAKDWAYWTAKQYGGRLLCEFSDGSVDVKGDWTWEHARTASESVSDSV